MDLPLSLLTAPARRHRRHDPVGANSPQLVTRFPPRPLRPPRTGPADGARREGDSVPLDRGRPCAVHPHRRVHLARRTQLAGGRRRRHTPCRHRLRPRQLPHGHNVAAHPLERPLRRLTPPKLPRTSNAACAATNKENTSVWTSVPEFPLRFAGGSFAELSARRVTV